MEDRNIEDRNMEDRNMENRNLADRNEVMVDVVVPVYKPGRKFSRLLAMLNKQTHPVSNIIIMNTEQGYWNDSGYQGIGNLKVHHLKKEEFDHGATRNKGESYSQADIVVFMTDDAVPQNEHLVEELVNGFSYRGRQGELPAVVYARQLAERDCRFIEQYTRSFNYPEEDRVKTKEDLSVLGIKTYFASNVCCAYDRKLFHKLGGFIDRTIFNEDMIFAAKAVDHGYAVVYKAAAMVVHSHNYSGLMQFHRNFDLAVSQADHPEVFEGIKSESEGIKLVKQTGLNLLKQKKGYLLPELVYKSGCKFIGYRLGKVYRHLPRKVVLWCSMNASYWKEKQKKAETGL